MLQFGHVPLLITNTALALLTPARWNLGPTWTVQPQPWALFSPHNLITRRCFSIFDSNDTDPIMISGGEFEKLRTELNKLHVRGRCSSKPVNRPRCKYICIFLNPTFPITDITMKCICGLAIILARGKILNPTFKLCCIKEPTVMPSQSSLRLLCAHCRKIMCVFLFG